VTERDMSESEGGETILDVRLLLNSTQDTEESEKTLIPSVLEFDVGNLLVFDYQEQPKGISQQINQTQKSVQELFNRVFSLPFTPSNTGPIAILPEPTTPIPREKPLPKQKLLTRWEKFAKTKGIKKTKRSRRVWDESTQEWRPRWGMNRANNPEENWIMEDKPEQLSRYGAEDPFHLEKIKKKDRLEKNKKLTVKNQKRVLAADKTNLPATLDITKNAPVHQKYSIERAMVLAQKSTASMGKFDKLHSDEPKIKYKDNYIDQSEQKTTAKIADRVLKKAESAKDLNIDKAVRTEMRNEQVKKGKRKLNEGRSEKGKIQKKRRKTK